MAVAKTRGERSSEFKAVMIAFCAGFFLAVIALLKSSDPDLAQVGVLIGAVTFPLMWYCGARTVFKMKQGEASYDLSQKEKE